LTPPARFDKNVGYTPAVMIETLMRMLGAKRLLNALCVSVFIPAGIVALAQLEDDPSRQLEMSAAGATPTPSPCSPCSGPIVLRENFDDVSPPTLPADWLATNVLGPPPLWVTSNNGVPAPPADTLPNAAVIDDPAVLSDKRLDSFHFPLAAASVQLTYRHNFNLEASDVDPNIGFDGGVLEISFDGGNTFQDILAAGGSFISGGYNRTIATDRGSPIAGRQAWSGNSLGFVTTVVNLPYIIPAGGRLRWRLATDNSGSGEGWRVDTVSFSWCEPRPGCHSTPRPRPTPHPRP
jgi:hypothetical protein